MAEQQQDPTNPGVMKLANYMQRTYYPNKSPKEIYDFAIANPQSFEKGLKQLHKDRFGQIEYSRFRDDYFARYGNPFAQPETKDATVTYPQELPSVAIETAKAAEQFDWAEVQKQIKALNIDPYSTEQVVPVIPGVQQTLTKDFLGDSSISMIEEKRQGDFTTTADQWAQRDITQYDKLRQRRRSPMESMYADAGFMSDDQSTLAQYQAEMQALANENAALDEALTKIEKDLNTSWAQKVGAEPEDFKGVFGWIKEQNNKLKPLISQIEQLQGQDLNNPEIRDRYNKIVEEYNVVLEPMKALEADPMYQKYQQYAQLHENNYQAAKEKLKQDNYRSVRELLDMQENIEQYDEQIAQQKGKLKKIDHFADHIILNSVAKAVADLGAWMNTLETNILGDEEYTTWDKIEDWTKDLAADAERVYPTPTKYSRPIFTQTSKWNGYEVDFRGEEIEAIRKPDGTAMIAQLSEQQKEEIRKLPRERQFNNEGLAWQVGAVTTDLLWQIAGTKGARTGLLKAGVKDKFATQAAVMGATAATLGYELEKEGLEIFDGDREKAAQYVATTAPLIGLVANFAGLEGKLAGGSGSFLDNLMKGSTPAMRARMAAGRFTVRDMAALRTTELLKAVGGEAFEEAILEKVVETGTRYMLGGGVDLPIIEDVMNEAVLAGAAALVMGGGQFSISKSDLYRSSFLEGVKNPGAFSEALGKSLRQGVIPFDVPAGMDREAQIEAAVQAQRGRLERVASQLQDINSQLDDKVDQSAVAVLLDARNQITDVINKARKDKNLPLEEKAQKKADEIDARLRTLLETGKLPESIAPTVPAYEAVTFVEEEVVETAQPGPGTPDVPAPVVEWDIEPTPEPVTDETPRVVEMKPTKPATRLRDAEGKRVNYRNIVGRLRQDPEDGTYYVETPQGQQYEVAGGGAADTPVSEIEGIKEVFPEPNVDYESDESIMITGREGDYSWVGENLTEDGAVRSVELRRNSDGKKLVITDPALAESISFARNMAREDVPDFNSADLAQNEAVDLNEKEVSRLAAELDNAPEVVDGFLEHNAAPLVQGGSPDAIARNSEGQFTDDELAEVSLWAEDTINMIDREYPESTYAANLKNRLSNVKAAADSLLEGETRPATEQPAVEQPTQDVQAEPEQPDAEPDAEPEPEFDAEPEPEQPDVSTEPVAAPPSNEARDVIDAYEQAPLSKKEVADVLYNNNLLEGDFATIEAALDKVPNDTVQDALERFRALKIHPKHRPAGLTQDQQNAYDAQLDRYARDLVQQLYRWAGIDPIDMRRAELGPSFSQWQYDGRVDYAANIALQAGLPDVANNLLSMQSYPPPRGFDIEAKIEGLKKRLLAKQAREFNLPETAPNLPKKRLSSWKNKVLKKKIRGKVLDPKKLNKEVSTIVEHTYNRLYAGDSKVLQTGNEPADPLGKMVDRNDGGGPLSQYDGASALLVAAMKNYVETWYKKNILKYPSIKQSDVDEALEELAYAEAEFDSVLLILDTRVEQATGAMTEAVVTEHNDPKKAVTDFLRSPLLSSRPEIHELIKQFITEGATDTQLRDTLLLAFAFSSAKLTPDGWVIRVSKHGKVPKVFALNPSKPAQRTNLIGSGLVDAFRAAHGIPKKKRAPVERETLGDKVAQMRLESATDEVYAALAEGVRIFTDDFYNWGDPNAVKDNRAIAARFLGKKNARRIDDWAQELADKWGIPFKGDGTQQGAIEIIIDAIIDGKISEYIDMRLEDQQNPAQQEEAEGLTMEEKEELPEGEVEQATQLADSIFDNLTDEEVSEFESALMPYMDEFGNVDWNAFAEDYNSEEIMDFLGWSQNLKDGVKRAIEQGAEPEEQAEDEVPADDLEIEGEGTEQEGETELEEDLPPWLLDEEPEDKAPIQQQPKTLEVKTLEAQLEAALKELAAAEDAMKRKSRELDRTLMDDTPDLFGDRKTQGGLFDMRADGSRKSEVMQSYRVRVQKAKETVKKLSSELEQAKSRGEQTLFDQQQMVDDLESGKIKEVKNGIGLNLLSPKAEEILMRKIRLQWKRTFTSHGDLPKVIADLNRDRMARITAWMRSVKIAADSLTANAKKAYGAPRFRLFGIEIGRRNPPKWVMEDINGALQNPTLHSVHPRLRTGHPIDPAVVRDLRTMRGQIDLMSQAMVSMGLATGDLAVTITANQGVYLTRSYRVHDDAEWLATIRNQPDWERIKRWYVNLQRKRALDMQKAIRAERAKVAAKQLQLSAGGLTVKQAIRLQKSIDHSNNIIIPRLQRNYNEALHASRNPDARLEAMIKDQQESFAFTGSAKKGKLGHKDLGILKARKNIPTEIRQLFGEYFDPRINYGKSIYRQIHLIANENFLREVKAQGIGTFLFEKPTTVGGVNYSVKIAAEGSKTMAPLNGLYTTPEIADALALYNVPISYGKGLLGDLNRWMSMGSLLVKSAKTIFSPVTHTRNFNSAPGFLLMSGNVFSAWYRDGTITEKMYNVGKQLLSDVALPWLFVPQMLLTNFGKGGLNIFNVSSKAGRAWDLAFKTNVWAKGDTSLEQELRYLIGNGLFDEEVTYSEMRDMINAQHQEQDSVFFNSLLSYDSLTNELRRLTETVAGMYQAEDLYHRIIAFYNERERYTHALHGMSWDDLVASGATVAADQMSRRAADNVRRTYQSYSMVPENIKAISRFPLLASFIQFTAESIRTGYQNILLIREDMADPRTKGIAMQRAAGMFFASVYGAALSEAATQVASGLLGLFDDEEDDDANTYRPFLPEWSENSAVSILSKDGPEFTYLDWGGQLVYGSTWGITGDILATTVGVGPAWNTYPDRLATEFMDVAGLDIAFENSLKAVFNMTRLTPDASPITYATGKEGVFDRAKYFLEKNQPGITYSAQRVGRALEKWGETGDKSDLIREMAVLSSGLRLTPIDIEETWQFMSRRYANSLREKRSIYRVQAARLDRQARELGKTLTPVERLNELEEYAILAMKEHQAVVEELIEVYHLAVNHGANYQVLDKLLNEAGVNKGNIEKIKRGQIFLPVLEPELKK